MADKDVRLWSMLCHLSALCGLLVPSFGAVLGPLVIWLIKRNDHPDIDANGKESLNFQISILIYTWVLGAVGAATLFLLVGFAFIFAAFLISVGGLIYAILGAVRTSNGEPHRYPFALRLVT